jgi:hypothetical protein
VKIGGRSPARRQGIEMVTKRAINLMIVDLNLLIGC